MHLQHELGKSHEKVTIIEAELVGGDYLNLIPILRCTLSVGKTCPTGTAHIWLSLAALERHHNDELIKNH